MNKTRSFGIGALALALLLLAGGSALAAQPSQTDPDWPCQTIKIDHLSLATLWGGPPIEKFLANWRTYPAAAALAQRLAQRRVPLTEAKAEIAAFEKASGKASQTQLLAFFAGAFSLLDHERFQVVQGLDRFGKRQIGYAAQIRKEIDALHEAQDADHPDAKKIAALGNEVYWDTRIFKKRKQMISYACFVPDKIEHRAFLLAQATAGLLP